MVEAAPVSEIPSKLLTHAQSVSSALVWGRALHARRFYGDLCGMYNSEDPDESCPVAFRARVVTALATVDAAYAEEGARIMLEAAYKVLGPPNGRTHSWQVPFGARTALRALGENIGAKELLPPEGIEAFKECFGDLLEFEVTLETCVQNLSLAEMQELVDTTDTDIRSLRERAFDKLYERCVNSV